MLSKKEWKHACFDEDSRHACFLPIQIGKNSQLILYGAGYGGLMFLELLRNRGIEPECFLDMSPQKQGRIIMGTPVCAPDNVDLSGKTVIVCLLKTGETYRQIRAMLTARGCQEVFHLYELREDHVLFANQPLIISPDQNLIWNNKCRLYHTYEMLEDDLSRQTLISIFKFLWSGFNESIPSLPLEDQYFADDVYSLKEDEVFVDCGAHVGEIMLQFFQRSYGQFEKYWAFDPDKKNVQALKKVCPKDFQQRTVIHCKALGDQYGIVRVRNYDGTNSVIREDGEEEAPCVTLDSFAEQLHPTILKIDVEGWELRLLNGARQMICRDKPVIAVAIYHQVQDFWEIPLLLKEWGPEYHLYLRSYLNIAETVLYAVPPERTRREENIS